MNDAVARAGIFQGVAPEVVEGIAKRLDSVTFSRGEVVFREGDVGDRLYIVMTGKVKIGRRDGDGRENVMVILGPTEMFGELALFDPGPRTSTVTALTDVAAKTMDGIALRRYVTDHPEIADQLLRVLARRLRRTNDVLSDLIFTDVPGRTAKQLLGLAQRFGVQEGLALRVDHDMTQTELAQLVGSSRETVNKALADFAQRGWIHVSRGSVVILDPERLARRAR